MSCEHFDFSLASLAVWQFPVIDCSRAGPGVVSHKYIHHLHSASGLLRHPGPSQHPLKDAQNRNLHVDRGADRCWIGLRSNRIIHSGKEPLLLAAFVNPSAGRSIGLSFDSQIAGLEDWPRSCDATRHPTPLLLRSRSPLLQHGFISIWIGSVEDTLFLLFLCFLTKERGRRRGSMGLCCCCCCYYCLPHSLLIRATLGSPWAGVSGHSYRWLESCSRLIR